MRAAHRNIVQMRNRMQWFAGLLAILIGAMFSACEHKGPEAANAKKSIVVASEASFPPMEFIDDKEQIVGFDIDVISAAALAAGINVEIRNVAWDGIFGALKDGQADVIASSVTITEERK